MNKIIGFIRLEIESGKASPSPPVGPALGLRGVNIMQFCKEFNNRCKQLNIKDGVPVPTIITVYDDKTFSFKMKTPSITYFIKKHLEISKGASKPGKENFLNIDIRSLYEIAEIKKIDSNLDIKSICKSLIGSVKSMGIKTIIVKN
uniref:Large ribosomal subunit protein uL11m n=1 Tax=Reclinomonas americana TaxID=48483 RepID=RM11_RECAM|nr:ribosomal protein L11 [Reclinomonas americana]O21234.1 RecName: Full=Large ribosomal subunit protein uL11m; AltName: Full=60S ribosomal protein L11, mitochondrial [Reclinomonas americana]AAD11861.1 ribosomal protein L11 [Reclinomonas americana]